MTAKLYGGLILLLLVVVFTIQNVTVVTVKFLFWEFSMSRSLLIFLVLATGILVGWFLSSFHQRRNKTSSKEEDELSA